MTQIQRTILQKGDAGNDVQELQQYLDIDPTGEFGPDTEEAVLVFQYHNELRADGIVGPFTWSHLLAKHHTKGNPDVWKWEGLVSYTSKSLH
jgi:peptidoglycan hydrolase-like protein with peptidoglycan-binding domain